MDFISELAQARILSGVIIVALFFIIVKFIFLMPIFIGFIILFVKLIFFKAPIEPLNYVLSYSWKNICIGFVATFILMIVGGVISNVISLFKP